MKATLPIVLMAIVMSGVPLSGVKADEAHYDNLIRELESVRALAQRYRKTDQGHPIEFRYDVFDLRVARLIADIRHHMQQRINGARVERFTIKSGKD